MILSDLSVKRPVFATVVSLLLVTFGMVTFLMLPLRELPDVSSPKVTIVTSYSGASANVIESKITDPIEGQLSGIEGIKFIDSTSSNGSSRIQIEFYPDRDMDNAANDVREAISRVSRRLPDEADDPIVWKDSGNGDAILYVMLKSETMSPVELTDYADRTLKDRLSLVDGVSSADLMGAREYVMRIELDPVAMAARGITAPDVEAALKKDNVELPAGEFDGSQRTLQIRLRRDYNTVDDFRRLVIQQDGSGTVYLEDIATIRTGAKEAKQLFKANGFNTVGLAIVPMSQANPLDVIEKVKEEIEQFRPFLPEGTEINWTYDASTFINSAINEVYATLAITVGLVVLVIYCFLGNLRATLIPAVTVPVSLVSAFIAIYALGYSINLLTLLALVLAIGLVVDDAIVVLENIHRRLETGEKPLIAAYRGAREVGFAVIATTLVLVMTFVPIIFLDGTIGRLFSEYALTLAGAVCFSSLIALTLSPMMGSKLLRLDTKESRLSKKLNTLIAGLEKGYGVLLNLTVKRKWIGVSLLATSLGLTALLYPLIPQSFTPKEDNGSIFILVRGAEGASFESMEESMELIEQRLLSYIDDGPVNNITVIAPGFRSMGDNSGFLVLNLKDWKDREQSAFELSAQLRKKLASIPNVTVFPVLRSSIGGRTKSPVQFVVGGGSFDQVQQWADILIEKARTNPGLTDIDIDYNETQPQVELTIDKVRAAELGVSAEAIGNTLEIMLAGKTSTTFMERGEEYDVYLKATTGRLISPKDVAALYVRSNTTGQLIRLDNLVKTEEVGQAARLPHYNRNRSITISANLTNGYSLGEALDYLDQQAVELLPAQAIIDYKDESLDYRSNQSSIYAVFGLAMVIVFLVLAAQFESFIHPLVVMVTVPLGLAGALFGLLVTGETLNIYSQLAMIMLIGLTTKNGILIVEFINQLRDKGLAFQEAVIAGAQKRLRPILMTALTTVAGSIPLLMAHGAGAESRFAIGVVVFSGVLLASLLTLIVVPSIYALIAGNTQSPEFISRKLENQLSATTVQ